MDDKSDSISAGLIAVRIEALCWLNHDAGDLDASSSSMARNGCAGAAGTVQSLGSGIDGFEVGDSVTVCLATTGNEEPPRQNDLISVPASVACRNTEQASHAQAARMTCCFLAAVAILHDTGRVPLAFLNQDSNRDSTSPTSILILANETPTSLIITRLLRNALPISSVLVLYDFEPAATDAEFDIIKPMKHGATYASKPESNEDPASVLASCKNAAKQYSGRDGVDLLIDLNGREELLELMREMVCEGGIVRRLRHGFQTNIIGLFEEHGVMAELSRLVRGGVLKAEELDVRRSS